MFHTLCSRAPKAGGAFCKDFSKKGQCCSGVEKIHQIESEKYRVNSSSAFANCPTSSSPGFNENVVHKG
jgi:hypothetical protein